MNTYSTESFASGLINLATLKAGFSRFRFENDEQRDIVACFIASQHADGDDELYCEFSDWLQS